MAFSKVLLFSAIIGLIFLGLSSPDSPPEEEPEVKQWVVTFEPPIVEEDNIRAQLASFAGANEEAFARVVALDKTGTWSRLYLGPFPSEKEAQKALERSRPSKDFTAQIELFAEFPGPDSPLPIEETPAFPVLVELAYLLADDEIYKDLAIPHQKGIYAFARTARAELSETGPLTYSNRLYLGPFPSELIARKTLESLSSWDLADEFSIVKIFLTKDNNTASSTE